MENIKLTPQGIINARFGLPNARHLINAVGVQEMRKLTENQLKALIEKEPCGFYSLAFRLGSSAINGIHFPHQLRALSKEIKMAETLQNAFRGFGGSSTHKFGGLTIRVSPGIDKLDALLMANPKISEEVSDAKSKIEGNLRDDKPIILKEDNPFSATEKPSIKQFREDLDDAAKESMKTWEALKRNVKKKWGLDAKSVRNVVVLGIGANDMYLQALSKMVNDDANRRARLFIAYGPGELLALPQDLNDGNTLVIAISRSGTTQDTLKTMELNRQMKKFSHVITFANKGPIRELAEKDGHIVSDLREDIGGRYMREKGKIVLIPLLAAASENFFDKYVKSMIAFDKKYAPTEEVFDMAAHVHFFTSAYNIPQIVAMSNMPVLEAGLREPIQLFNEAVGKISNYTLMGRPGMDIAPFAHAGIEGFMEGAWNGGLYGLFVFDTSTRPDSLKLKSDAVMDKDHEGLPLDVINLAFAYPNWAKFNFVGGPNILITMDGVTPENISTLTSFYVNLIWPLLIMKGCNPSSNPQVAAVRKLTGGLLKKVAAGLKEGRNPLKVIEEAIPDLMNQS